MRLRSFLEKSIEKWVKSGYSKETGMFAESLTPNFESSNQGFLRLVVQARQIFVCSEGSRIGIGDWEEVARNALGALQRNFRTEELGGWKYSIGDSAKLESSHYDLYGHAFVVLASAAYFRCSNDKIGAELAEQTVRFIRRHFRHPVRGYFSVLDKNLRPVGTRLEQNPHMHLLEALLWCWNSGIQFDGIENDISDLVTMLLDCFFDNETGTLTEVFSEDWTPHPNGGERIEPGHHFEWVWLLSMVIRCEIGVDCVSAKQVMNRLMKWGVIYGIDYERGGIYNVVSRFGVVLNDSKRIWPVTEAIKAFSIFDANSFRVIGMDLEELLFNRYLNVDSGSWNESLDVDLRPTTSVLPGTTLYHILMCQIKT
jgi:mannose/cellobiose epimerase-like protein (N-acyl-D-glucosamine 2-epimerase family)